jgi:hypothetical protein
MIDTALKHFIYETCLDVVFDNITKNFALASVDIVNAKKGDKFRFILIYGYMGGFRNDTGSNSVHEFIDCVVIKTSKYSLHFTGSHTTKTIPGEYFVDFGAITQYEKYD